MAHSDYVQVKPSVNGNGYLPLEQSRNMEHDLYLLQSYQHPIKIPSDAKQLLAIAKQYFEQFIKKSLDQLDLKAKWDRVIHYLEELPTLASELDEIGIPQPNIIALENAIAAIGYLATYIAQPPRVMIDEDSDVCLTWGDAQQGLFIFLTLSEEIIYLHIMMDDQSIYTDEKPYKKEQPLPSTIVQQLIKYIHHDEKSI